MDQTLEQPWDNAGNVCRRLQFRLAKIFTPVRTAETFISSSDTRLIIGMDEAALLRLWREKRGG